MKPIIGITVDCLPNPEDARSGGKLQLNWNYAQYVADSGGVPLLIPPQADPSEVLSIIDGLLIPGGNDIDASNWGETNHSSVTPIAQERFEVEQKLYRTASNELPILGICYGCQFVNVMQGGSLIQHLPEISGSDAHTAGLEQTYHVDPSSHLGSIVGQQASGQSWHHQAIDRIGSGLRVVARERDGTVEAIEAEDRPWLIGVQWHPERTPEDPATIALITQFIAAATRYRVLKKEALATK